MRRGLASFLSSSDFKRALISVASGTAIAHTITIVAAPILSRIFAPDAYGILGTFTTISALLGAISCLRLDAAIVAAEPSERQTVFSTALLTTALFTLVMATVCSVLVLWLPITLLSSYSSALAALPLTVAAIGIYNATSQWLAVNGLFNALSLSNVSRAIGGHSAQLSAGLITRQAPGLIWGNLVGHLVALGYSLRAVYLKSPDLLRARLDTVSVLRTMRSQREFILFGTPQTLLGILNYSFPILVLAVNFPPSVIGSYAMAQRLLTMPTSVIANALRQVLYPRLADAQRTGSAKNTIIRLVRILVPLVAIGAAIAYFGSPIIFTTLLGPEWVTAGLVAQYLTFWVSASLISLPVVSALPLVGLQGFHSRFEGALLLLRFASTALGVHLANLEVAVLLPSLLSLAANVGLTFWVLTRPATLWATAQVDARSE